MNLRHASQVAYGELIQARLKAYLAWALLRIIRWLFLGYFALRDLLDSLNLEFFGVTLVAHVILLSQFL